MPSFAKVGGVWLAGQLSVKSGGVWQGAQGSAKSGGVWQGFSSYPLSLTAGSYTHLTVTYLGYSNGSPSTFGSITPTTIGVPAITVAAFFDNTSAGVGAIFLSGFASNPGSTYLYSATANSVTQLGSTASYSYGTGTAVWDFPAIFGFANTTTYPVSLAIG
jgi:hypothetical protein